MSRGDVVHSGVRQINYQKVDKVDLAPSLLDGEKQNLEANNFNDIGSVEFEIEIQSDFSPKISILAYFIRPDKEVVTATFGPLDVENCFPNPVPLFQNLQLPISNSILPSLICEIR